MLVDMSKHLTMSQLLKYALPSIVTMIFMSLYVVVDGLFVSNFAGSRALAAVNIVYPVLMVFGSVGFMIGTGGSAIVAKTRGEGDDVRANRYFSMLVYGAFLLGIVLMACGYAMVDPLCRLMGADGEMLELCRQYGYVGLVSLPFFVLQYVFQSFFVTAGKPQIGLYVIVAAGVTNMVLDALFIGVFGWGVAGAAAATAAGEVLGGTIPLVYFFRKNASYLRLGRTRFEGRVFGKACANGSSEMVGNIAMSVVSMLFNFQLLRLVGEDGVAAYSVIMYVAMVFGAVFIGYSMGTSPLMSYQFGAHNRVEQQSIFRKSVGFSFVGGVAMCLVAQVAARPLSEVFVGYDAELLDMTVTAFQIYALMYLPMGFCVYASGLFTAVNNGLVSALISLLRTFVFEAGAVLLLPVAFGANGIWFATPVAELAALVVACVFVLAFGSHYGFLKPRKKGKPRRPAC